jgi:hypothetical protein
MLDYIALPAAVFVVAAAFVTIAVRSRNRNFDGRIMRALHPVSQHWLADFRRTG